MKSSLFHTSGQSVTSRCFQQDIAIKNFYYWRKRLAVSTPLVPSPPQWLAVSSPPAATPTLTLRVGPVAIQVSAGFDPRLLADVLTMSEGRL